MTQGVYYIGVDTNRDGYFPRGVQITDAINQFNDPERIYAIPYNGATAVDFRRENRFITTAAPAYTYYYDIETGTNADAGAYIGYSDYPFNNIIVDIGVQITVRIEVWAFGGLNEQLSWQVMDYFFSTSSGVQTVALTTTPTATSITFTPTEDRILLRLYRSSSTNDIHMYVRNIQISVGASSPTAYNTGATSDAYEDITDYLITATWNNGADKPDQDMSAGAKCTLVLDNRERHFDQDGLGAELITNGNFSSWSPNVPNDTPTGWTLLGGISVIETGADGETGTGSCSLTGTGTGQRYIYQTILTVGTAYWVTFDIGSAVEGSLLQAFCGTTPVSRYYGAPGHYEFAFVATATVFGIGYDRPAGGIVTLDNVSVKSCPRYYGLARDTLIAIRGWDGNTEYPLFVGKMVSIVPYGGNLDTRTVTIECIDWMNDLSSQEYIPDSVVNNELVQVAMARMLGSIEVAQPYLSSFWYLDQSILGVDTWLFDGAVAGSLEGTTVLDYSGDVATNNRRGVAAHSYARDLMASEMGGRFYYDVRYGGFFMLGRRADAQINNVTYTLTDDDYEDYSYSYADDVINEVTVFYKQRRAGATNQVLWSSEVDIVVEPGRTSRITGRYRDPSNEQLQVSSTGTEPLAYGVDYSISPAAQASKVTVTVAPGAQSATFTILNESAVNITVTGLRVRGNILYAITEQSITAQNTDSIFKHNRHKQSYNIPLISNPDDVLGFATSQTTLYAEPFGHLESIAFQATKTAARYTRALGLQLFNVNRRVSITQSFDGHVGDYVVVGERHNLVAGGEHTHNVTWILKPIGRLSYWYLGEAGRSELGITTTLAF